MREFRLRLWLIYVGIGLWRSRFRFWGICWWFKMWVDFGLGLLLLVDLVIRLLNRIVSILNKLFKKLKRFSRFQYKYLLIRRLGWKYLMGPKDAKMWVIHYFGGFLIHLLEWRSTLKSEGGTLPLWKYLGSHMIVGQAFLLLM